MRTLPSVDVTFVQCLADACVFRLMKEGSAVITIVCTWMAFARQEIKPGVTSLEGT